MCCFVFRSGYGFFAAIVLALSLAACGSSGSHENATTAPPLILTTTTEATTTSTTSGVTSAAPEWIKEYLEDLQTTTTAAPPVVVGWGEPVEVYGLSVTVEAPKADTTSPTVIREEQLWYCMVTIVNHDSEPYEYGAICFQMLDEQSQPYDSGGEVRLPQLVRGFVQQGRTIRGAVAFTLPKGAQPATLIFSPVYGLPEQAIWERSKPGLEAEE